jgi:polar amino acid transport system ATP-binding protein
MKILEMNHVKKSFKDTKVLKDISLAVEEGEVVSIIGPSGSGKSTLLRCATFLETMDDGSLTYVGDPVVQSVNGSASYGSKAAQKKACGYFGLVFQNFNLFPHFSVIKNITDAPIRNQKRDKAEVYREARELLAKMGLSDKENAYPCELSGGQKQRVSIARALAMKPKILFFDEPTSALDPELTIEILKVIKNLAKENMTMVIVTHEMSFARDVSDRIIFMEHGMIVEDTTPQALFTSDNARTREFLGKYHNS